MNNPTPFIEKNADEFTGVTTLNHIKELSCGSGFLSDGGGTVNLYELRLREIRKGESSSLLLDCKITARNDWFFARNCDIIFNCDGANTSVKFHETKTDNTVVDQTSILYEWGYYELNEELFALVCSCTTLKIRICGAHSYEQPDASFCEKFKKYCRQYYNNTRNPELYKEDSQAKASSGGFFSISGNKGNADGGGKPTGDKGTLCLLILFFWPAAIWYYKTRRWN